MQELIGIFRIIQNPHSLRANYAKYALNQLCYIFLPFLAHQCPIFLKGNGAYKTPYSYDPNAYCPICPIFLVILEINNDQYLYTSPYPITKFTKTWDKWDRCHKTHIYMNKTRPISHFQDGATNANTRKSKHG